MLVESQTVQLRARRRLARLSNKAKLLIKEPSPQEGVPVSAQVIAVQKRAVTNLTLFLAHLNGMDEDVAIANSPEIPDIRRIDLDAHIQRLEALQNEDPFSSNDPDDPYGTRNAKSVNYKNSAKNDRTPLHLSVLSNNLELVMSLVENYNAEISIRDRDGKTALQLAIQFNYTSIVNFIRHWMKKSK